MWVETIDIKTKTSFLFQQKVKNILIFTNDRIDVANSILSSSTFIYFRYFTNWYRLHILWLTSIFEKEENNVNTSAIINISIDSKTKKRKRKYSHNISFPPIELPQRKIGRKINSRSPIIIELKEAGNRDRFRVSSLRSTPPTPSRPHHQSLEFHPNFCLNPSSLNLGQ